MTAHLAFDEFYGRGGPSSRAGGFAVAHRSATVPARRVERHRHAEAHFVLVLRGVYASEARNAPGPGGPAEPLLVYNPPGTHHRDRFLAPGGAFFTVSVAPWALDEHADAVDLPVGARVLGPDARALARRLARVARDGALDGPLLESFGTALLTAAAGDSAEPAGSMRPVPAWLRRVREHLHDECVAGPALRDLAGAARVHPVHLSRAFRRAYGCTPGEYLRRCRLGRAATALAAGDLPLAEVALDCGFFDQAHLGRAFRAAFGVPPGAYRRRWRAGFSRYKTGSGDGV